MNEAMGGETMLARSTWPEYDPAKCVDDTVEMVVQVCGKIKARITVAADAGQEEVTAIAKAEKAVQAALEGKETVKEIFVKGKLLNIVAR